MVKDQPVGIIDSGIGGMTVAQEIRRLLPHENLIYIADQQMLPYGNKSEQQICQRMMMLGKWLIQQHHIKMLVIACNTATAAAAGTLRHALPVPVIGMEPAVKPAAQATRNRHIGILATEGTLKSARFAALLKTFAQGLHVTTQPCPGLVEAIESCDTRQTSTLLKQYIQPLKHRQVDVIVLGCTHYPLVRDSIADIAGDDICLIDTGAAVARHTARQLMHHKLLNPQSGVGSFRATSTTDNDTFQALLQRLFGHVTVDAVLMPPHR